jgi:hypothetical protein
MDAALADYIGYFDLMASLFGDFAQRSHNQKSGNRLQFSVYGELLEPRSGSWTGCRVGQIGLDSAVKNEARLDTLLNFLHS